MYLTIIPATDVERRVPGSSEKYPTGLIQTASTGKTEVKAWTTLSKATD